MKSRDTGGTNRGVAEARTGHACDENTKLKSCWEEAESLYGFKKATPTLWTIVTRAESTREADKVQVMAPGLMLASSHFSSF